MMLFWLAALCAALALPPALLFWRNLALYAPPPEPAADAESAAVSILIPARNEERSIGQALAAALASEGIDLEVIVLDDQSTDRTAAIVREFAARDPRVRLEVAPPLPAGWCGKQHACHVLAQRAAYDRLLFLDADVRLAPRGAARAVAFLERSGAALVSGVPRQETRTWLEKLLIPLIHFILLGFLPLDRMRRDGRPSLGAGCGQLFLAHRAAYRRAGGHAAIRHSLHDGVTLPRAFRAAGEQTDLFDATGIATCRMYHSAGEVWRGLAKNATEGLAAPSMIVPATILLAGGQLLPWGLLLLALASHGTPFIASPLTAGLLASSIAASLAVRLAAAWRFRQPLLGALLHPLAIGIFLALQWWALIAHLRGRPATWKERSYGSSAAPAPAAHDASACSMAKNVS